MLLCFMPCFLCLDLLFPMFFMLDPHASMSHTMCLCLDLSFPCVVWLDLHVSMLVHMFFYLDLHVLCFMPCFPMLCSSFCSRLMLGLHAHMLVWCCWLCLAGIYGFMCLFPCYMSISMFSHAYVLGSVFFTCFMPSSRCLHASRIVCDAMCYCSHFVHFVIFSCVLA